MGQLWPTGCRLGILTLNYREIQREYSLDFPVFRLKDWILTITSISCELQSSLLRNKTFLCIPWYPILKSLSVVIRLKSLLWFLSSNAL